MKLVAEQFKQYGESSANYAGHYNYDGYDGANIPFKHFSLNIGDFCFKLRLNFDKVSLGREVVLKVFQIFLNCRNLFPHVAQLFFNSRKLFFRWQPICITGFAWGDSFDDFFGCRLGQASGDKVFYCSMGVEREHLRYQPLLITFYYNLIARKKEGITSATEMEAGQ